MVARPEGPYSPVTSGDALQTLLQDGSSVPLYLELAGRSVFRILDGLNPAANTVASILCGERTIDMTDAKEYEAEPGTKLSFWGCKIHLTHSAPLARDTSFHNSDIYANCQVLSSASSSCKHIRFSSYHSTVQYLCCSSSC
jgi:hypothetical protein